MKLARIIKSKLRDTAAEVIIGNKAGDAYDVIAAVWQGDTIQFGLAFGS